MSSTISRSSLSRSSTPQLTSEDLEPPTTEVYNDKSIEDFTQLIKNDPRLLDQMEIVYRDQELWKQEQLRKQKLVAGKFQKVLTETELEELREIFRLVDVDDSGEITSQELGIMLQIIGLPATEEDIQKMMAEVDTDGSGGKY